MLEKIKQLEKKQKILIIVVLIAVLSFGIIDRFFDGGDGDGDGQFGKGNQFERRFNNGEDGEGSDGGGLGKNGRFSGEDGAKENFASSALQLAIVAAGIAVFTVNIKPKDMKEVRHVILGSKESSK